MQPENGGAKSEQQLAAHATDDHVIGHGTGESRLPGCCQGWLTDTLLSLSQQNETASNSRGGGGGGGGYDESNSPSSSTTASTSTDADLLIAGDLNKAARVEEISGDLDTDTDTVTNANRQRFTDNSTPRSIEGSGADAGGGPYDVIDVMAATSAGVGRPKTSGQTTRIYTTGDVNEDFWLKHLGDDFKHAIHLQVGGTNEDYNRIINQTSDGVHEEVHHEYLPGAERPQGVQQQQQYPQQEQQQQQQQYPQQPQQQQPQHALRTGGYGQPNLVSQLSLDGEAMALKQNYLRQQQQQQQRFAQGFAQPYLPNNNINSNNNNRHTYATHPTVQHPTQTAHTQHTVQHTHTQAQHTPTQYTRSGKSRHQLRNRYKQPEQPAPSSIINSSEDTLHTSQSQATPTSTQHHAGSSVSSSALRRDDGDSQLPFKSPFNDYGSRTTRDLTYLLYKRGL